MLLAPLFAGVLGARMRQQSGEERALQHLLQQLSVAVQRGNDAAVKPRAQWVVLHQTFLCSVSDSLFLVNNNNNNNNYYNKLHKN